LTIQDLLFDKKIDRVIDAVGTIVKQCSRDLQVQQELHKRDVYLKSQKVDWALVFSFPKDEELCDQVRRRIALLESKECLRALILSNGEQDSTHLHFYKMF